MAGGGVGEAALLEAVIASEAAGVAAGGSLLGTALPAGGIAALAGAGGLGAGALGAGALGAEAGLAGGSGGLANLTPLLEGEFGTAALNPAIASATQAAMQPGVVPSALETGANLYQPGLGQGNNIAQMMGNPVVEMASAGTPQAAVKAAAQTVDPNAAMSEALRADPSLTMGPASPYPTPGGVNFNDAMSKAMRVGDPTMSGRSDEKGFIDQAMKAYGDLPATLRYGLGAMGAMKAINALDGNKYGTPEKEKYEGPLSKFKYDPSRYSPLVPQPRRMAGGGLSDLGGYADYARGGRMLKGPGDGMSDSIPATIAGKQPARLANDEFVVPADVVSHLGNGSSDAGAKQLYRMMDKVRAARTGKKSQAKQINPDKYMPA
jgi:hypothetical protein